MRRALASVGGRAALGECLGQPALLIREGRFILLSSSEARVRFLDSGAQRGELLSHGQQLLLDVADGLELVLRVGHVDADAFDLAAQRLDLGGARDLRLELAIHVGGQRIERVQSCLDTLDELLLRGQTRHLPLEIRGNCFEVGGLLTLVVDRRQLAADCLEPRLELRDPGLERGRPIEKRFERAAVVGQAIAQPHDLGVRGVEILNLFAESLEVHTTLFQALELRGGSLAERVDLGQ